MRIFHRNKEFLFHNKREKKLIPIVGDAAIASEKIGDGRLVPLIIIDTSDRPELSELIRVHQHLPPGDVEVQWGQVQGATGRVVLVLSFRKPVETVAILDFDIIKQGILVDQILTARFFYLQSGQPGDRFITNPTAPRIFVEVPDTHFREHWDKLFHKQITKYMRTKGFARKQAKQAAIQAIKQMRDFGRFRMKSK